MKYSSVGVSGLDVLFMSDSEREVFYQRIPLFTQKELQTIVSTLKKNQKAIENLNLRKDADTPEFIEVYSEIQQYKSRFFKTGGQNPSRLEEPDISAFSFGDLTSEFDSDASEEEISIDSMFEDLVEDIISEISPLEEVEIFIRAKGLSSDLRPSIDKRVLENNFTSILNKYNRIPADVKPLQGNPLFKDPFVLNMIKALSKRVHLTDRIIQEMRQENKNTLVDITIQGKVVTSSRRISIYKRFSEKRKTRDEVKFTLTQITRQLKNLPTDDMAYVDNDSDFEASVREYLSKEDESAQNKPIEHKVLQLVPLYKVLKCVQMVEFSEIFGKCSPARMDVIKTSRLAALTAGIVGLLPDQCETLVQSISALNLKPIAVALPEETIFVMEVLAMSLVSQKYDMITGVSHR